MALIVIEVDPEQLSDPDLDVRFALPELLEAASAGSVTGAGDGVDEDERVHIYLDTADLVAGVRLITQILQSRLLEGEDLSRCRIGVRNAPGQPFDVVFPEGAAATIPDLDS